MERNAKEIKDFVKKRYGRLARAKNQSCCAPQMATPSCCDATSISRELPERVAALYRGEELDKLPTEVANSSLGCGNPTALAELREGEVVLDLGSGGGLDCFLAAQRVGQGGRVIGLDMTPEMVQLARRNAQKVDATNVEFRLGEMEHMPVADNSVDVIISNCVINLAPDKDVVFREAYRVLKPGGRLCVSDIVLLGELPKKVSKSLEQWAGCIAGALHERDYLAKVKAAGFVEVSAERNTLPLYAESSGAKRYLDLRDKVASVNVRARKSC